MKKKQMPFTNQNECSKAWQSNQFNKNESKGDVKKKQVKGVQNWFLWHSERTTWAVLVCPIKEIITSWKNWEDGERKGGKMQTAFKDNHVDK